MGKLQGSSGIIELELASVSVLEYSLDHTWVRIVDAQLREAALAKATFQSSPPDGRRFRQDSAVAWELRTAARHRAIGEEAILPDTVLHQLTALARALLESLAEVLNLHRYIAFAKTHAGHIVRMRELRRHPCEGFAVQGDRELRLGLEDVAEMELFTKRQAILWQPDNSPILNATLSIPCQAIKADVVADIPEESCTRDVRVCWCDAGHDGATSHNHNFHDKSASAARLQQSRTPIP
mmetsp:Transcript_82246/g.265244  ORF Transcript_82246/g.265244 Transcript_82246/m.265244 type:complete len:238 (+) Transcript_82246:143-856(+)